MEGLAVVHLARRRNGIAPFQRFLASWQSHPAGVPHDLVIVFKGFDGSCPEHDALLSHVTHRRLFVSDQGFELNAYFKAVEQLDYSRYCFLNSYSRILADGWLEKMNRWCDGRDVGLVGATGSCQSIAGGYTREERQLKSLPLATQFWRRAGRALRDRRPNANAQRAIRLVLRMAGVWRPSRDFPPFPNPHLRTNAFMASRDTLRQVRLGPLRMKLSAYKFESGKDSLTNQVRRLGLRVLVVGRDGESYQPERWHESNTFWQSREENLLVADNQTELYMSSDAATRAELAQYAWGDNARPG
jgi:hypothetical protein